MKQFTPQQLWDKFAELNKTKQLEVMDSALDYMQQYSGITKQCCIFRAMGYEDEEGDGKFYTKL